MTRHALVLTSLSMFVVNGIEAGTSDLRAGANAVKLTVSNTRGSNHGGWCFAFRCRGADGRIILPDAPAGD